MKSILLTSTALVAFAGAAVADGHTGISFAGSATLGYNAYDTDATDITITNDDHDGFYWDAEIDVTMSAELDNGLTATAAFDFDVADDNVGEALVSGGYVLSLESETAGLFFGDTAFAAETRWSSAGDMEADSFSEADGEAVLRGDVAFGGVEASISYAVADAGGQFVDVDDAAAPAVNPYDDEVDQLSVGVVGTFGNFTVGAAYQEESIAVDDADATADATDYDPSDENGDFNTDEVFGVFASASLGGADITVAYAEETNSGESSTGIKVAYPVGPVTATAYFVSEEGSDLPDEDPNLGLNLAYADGPLAVELDLQDDQGVSKWALEGSYDVGNGLTVLAGVLNDNEADEDFYIAGEYDLGGGAELLVSYGLDDDGDNGDEIGDPEYQAGTTVEVSFSF